MSDDVHARTYTILVSADGMIEFETELFFDKSKAISLARIFDKHWPGDNVYLTEKVTNISTNTYSIDFQDTQVGDLSHT